PTGKAASNLLESIKRVLPSADLQAKTLHSLLGIRRVETARKRFELPYDLIIVDESSMIDTSLCVKLLYSVAEGSRIIFMGDPFQLPPIEPGEPFVGFVEQQIEMKVADVDGGLVTTKRQECRAILDLAAAVKEADVDKALMFLQNDSSLQLLPLEKL